MTVLANPTKPLRSSLSRVLNITSAPHRPFPDTALSEGQVLLTEILAGLPAGTAQPIIQISPVFPSTRAGGVALSLAIAAAYRIGRTLLVSSHNASCLDPGGARAVSARVIKILTHECESILPDAEITGLYHTNLSHEGAVAPSLLRMDEWSKDARCFQTIVIDCPSTKSDPRMISIAALCHGTILAVAAGITRLDELQTAERQLASAGIRVFGAVLHDASSIGMRLPWRRT